MTDFFKGISPVKFEGRNSANPLAYRHYNKDGRCGPREGVGGRSIPAHPQASTNLAALRLLEVSYGAVD